MNPLATILSIISIDLAPEIWDRSEMKENLLKILDEIPVALSFVQEGKLFFINHKYRTMLGIQDSKAVLGRPATDFFAPEKAPTIKKGFKLRSQNRGAQSEYESILLHSNGNRIPVRVLTSELFLGKKKTTLAVFTDVNNAGSPEKRSSKPESGPTVFRENASDLIWSLNPEDFSLLNYNEAFSALYEEQKKQAPFLGMKLTDICGQTASDEWKSLYLRALKGPYRAEYFNESGGEFYDLDLIPHRGDRGEIVISVFARDKSNEKQLRDQLEQSEKSTIMETMLSTLAHEIRNPNQYIQANAGYLAQAWEDIYPILKSHREEKGPYNLGGIDFDEIGPQINTLFDAIQHGSKRIFELVEEYRSNWSWKNREEPQINDVNTSVRATLELLRPILRAATQNFSFWPDLKEPQILAVNRHLEQVMINLLKNACQSLDNRNQAISVTIFSNHESVFILVKDEGRGMSPEVLEKITQAFFTTKAKNQGMGLGLYLCKEILQTMGGRINFDSAPGKGTSVFLEIDLCRRPSDS